MKRLLHFQLFLTLAVFTSTKVSAQCAISATTGLHGYGCGVGDRIDTYVLDGIAAANAGCASNNYIFFSTPVWNLTIGNTYTWSATTGNNVYNQALAIWIDLNNDGQFTSNEQLANSNPALSHTGTFTIPFTATPGSNVRMRLRCNYSSPIGNTNTTACEIYGAPNYNFYYGETEDYNVTLISPTPCTSVPISNTVVAPSLSICPNSNAFLTLAATNTVGGITYAWQSSTISPVGPFAAVPNGTGSSLSTPNLTVNTYFQAIITCTNVAGFTIASPGLVSVSPVIINSVPYLETFEGLDANNKLPNCSWAASNLPNITQTYISAQNQNRIPHSGSKFAAFYCYYTSGANYFYSNGIQMVAGITYSASMWYTTEYYGYTNVQDLSLMYGTSQSSTGLVTIASHSPAASPIYVALTNTFMVPSSGIYYLAVRATGNGNYGTSYLSWDDLQVIIPCSLNSSSVSLSISSQTICNGQPVNITAAGADGYTWNTGATGPLLTDMPNSNSIYTVVGTNTLTGCATTVQSQMVFVLPSPDITAYSTKPVICAGQISNLVANGASSYTWSTNSNNSIVTVTPAVTTTYLVAGSNAFNCITNSSVTVMVNPLPTVTINNSGSSNNELCKGESVTLTGNGAATYQWASNSIFIQSQQALVSPNVSTTYTLTGTDINGCAGKTTISLNVNGCVGINQITTTLNGIKIYPNPTSGVFTVELNNASVKNIQVTDLTGRVILSNVDNSEKIDMNINALANGIYYVKIQSDNAVEVIKIVKQ